MGGRGSSNPRGGGSGGSGKSGGATGWRSDYNKAVAAEKEYQKQAESMDANVKAARAAYYAAPTRTKAQKAESERLEKEYNDLSMQQTMLRYRAAQMGTLADNLLSENAPGEYRRKKRVRNSR